MKIICLDTQDCGHVKYLSNSEIKEVNIAAPFVKCELCGYSALITTKNIEENIDLKVYKKLIEAFKEE